MYCWETTIQHYTFKNKFFRWPRSKLGSSALSVWAKVQFFSSVPLPSLFMGSALLSCVSMAETWNCPNCEYLQPAWRVSSSSPPSYFSQVREVSCDPFSIQWGKLLCNHHNYGRNHVSEHSGCQEISIYKCLLWCMLVGISILWTLP